MATGAFFALGGNARAQNAAPPIGTVTEQGGHLAFLGADGTVTVYETVYTYLLPESDREALHRGIPAHTQKELEALLEDYGL